MFSGCISDMSIYLLIKIRNIIVVIFQIAKKFKSAIFSKYIPPLSQLYVRCNQHYL